MSRNTRIGIVSVAAVVIGGLFIHAAQNKKPTAEAQIIVLKLDEGKKPGDNFVDDYIATQSQLLSSRMIAKAAVQLGNLDQLASIKGKDAAETILTSLKVERSPNRDNPILTIRVADLPGSDAVAVLDAVLLAYQQHVKEVYRSPNEKFAKTVADTSSDIEKQIQNADEQLKEFYADAPAFFAFGNRSDSQQEHLKNMEHLVNLRAEYRSLASRFAILADASKNRDMSKAVQHKAREWGKNIGLDPSESTVDSYLASIQLDLAILEKQRNSFEGANAKLTEKVRNLMMLETKHAQLQDNRARAVTQHALLQRLIQNNAIEAPVAGILVRVIAKPHVVE